MRFANRLLPGMLLLSLVTSVRADLVPPGQLFFPTQLVNTTSPPMATTLTNNGNQTLTVVSVVALAPVIDAYARAGGSCGATPFTIAAQASCTIAHTFRPNAIEAFYQTGRVTLAGGAFVDFGLAGNGNAGRVGLSPRTLLFPSVPVGTTGSQLTVAVNNVENFPLQITRIDSTGAVGAFVRTGGSCPPPPILLNGFTGCTISYTFMPAEVGESAASVSFPTTSASGLSLELFGEGLPGNAIFKDGFD